MHPTHIHDDDDAPLVVEEEERQSQNSSLQWMGHSQNIFVTYPNFNNILCLKKTLYFIFIVKFVIIDHVGSRMTVINYVEYFIINK